MLNRAEIITKAWAGYRAQKAAAKSAAISLGVPYQPRFSRRLFSSYLRSEWRNAKGRILLEARIAAEARMDPRVREVRAELLSMDLTDAPIDRERYSNLTAELFRLSVSGEAPQ